MFSYPADAVIRSTFAWPQAEAPKIAVGQTFDVIVGQEVESVHGKGSHDFRRRSPPTPDDAVELTSDNHRIRYSWQLC